MFGPPIIGTPAFYSEAYNLRGTQTASAFGYSETKWDFDEALKDARQCKQVFEFGTGPGHFLSHVQAAGVAVAGVEYSDEARASAQARGLQVMSHNEPLHAWRGRCDAAFAFHVLEHVATPVDFVRTMLDMVRPGGFIGISVPNQEGPIRFIEPCVMNMPPHHASRWRLSAFEALAKKLELRIRRVAYEPLLLENHGYYSVFWPKRKVTSLVLRGFFGSLRRLGLQYFHPLKGQSMYVVMSAVNR